MCAKYGVRGWSRRDEEEDEGDETPGAAPVPDVQLSFEMM
jgi:hypothetical protein